MSVALAVALVWFGAAVVLAGRRAFGLAAVLGAGGLALTLRSVPLGAAVGLHLLLGLPDGAVPGRARRLAVATGYVLAAASISRDAGRPGTWLVVGLVVAVAIVGLPASNTTYRRAPAAGRQRMQWVGAALVVLAEGALVLAALRLLTQWPGRPQDVLVVLTSGLPLALVAATTPRVAVRIDRVLTHVVSTVGLTAVVVGAYLLIVVGLGRLPERGERSVLLLSMAAAAVVAAVHPAASRYLATFANRVVYGERSAPDDALRTFGTRMTRAVPLDELLLQLAESLRKTFSLQAASVWTGSGGTLRRTVSVPRRPEAELVVGEKELAVVVRAGVSGGTWVDIWLPALAEDADTSRLRVAPLAHAGELLGLLVLERRAESDPPSDEDDRVLADLSRQVALALHNAELDTALQASLVEVQRKAVELQASRARIVTAGDTERRKLERDLHDGAQQQLVALAMRLRLARSSIEDGETEAALALLEQLQTDVGDAVQELRALAHGIFPPLLASDGLAAALRTATQRSSLPTTLSADDVGRYPPEVEAAVYFCCLEALQNAGKHAGDGATAAVRLWTERGELHFEVADDGAGFLTDGSTASGHGFVNMADRLGAYGGGVTVISSPGTGTRIAGHVRLDDASLGTAPPLAR